MATVFTPPGQAFTQSLSFKEVAAREEELSPQLVTRRL